MKQKNMRPIWTSLLILLVFYNNMYMSSKEEVHVHHTVTQCVMGIAGEAIVVGGAGWISFSLPGAAIGVVSGGMMGAATYCFEE